MQLSTIILGLFSSVTLVSAASLEDKHVHFVRNEDGTSEVRKRFISAPPNCGKEDLYTRCALDNLWACSGIHPVAALQWLVYCTITYDPNLTLFVALLPAMAAATARMMRTATSEAFEERHP